MKTEGEGVRDQTSWTERADTERRFDMDGYLVTVWYEGERKSKWGDICYGCGKNRPRKKGTMGVEVPWDLALPKRMSHGTTTSTSNVCGKPLWSTQMHTCTFSVRQTHLDTQIPTHTSSTSGPCQAGIPAKTKNLCSPSHPSKHENNKLNFYHVQTLHTC